MEDVFEEEGADFGGLVAVLGAAVETWVWAEVCASRAVSSPL